MTGGRCFRDACEQTQGFSAGRPTGRPCYWLRGAEKKLPLPVKVSIRKIYHNRPNPGPRSIGKRVCKQSRAIGQRSQGARGSPFLPSQRHVSSLTLRGVSSCPRTSPATSSIEPRSFILVPHYVALFPGCCGQQFDQWQSTMRKTHGRFFVGIFYGLRLFL